MLCSRELIRDYLALTKRDLIARIIAGEEVHGINYNRRAHKTHKYVAFNYIYGQRTYIIEISCNVLDGYFTTVDNMVYSKQDVYETIFSHDRSYVSEIAREYIMLKLSTNDAIGLSGLYDNVQIEDIGQFLEIITRLNLKIKFGKFDFGQLWEMETAAKTNGGASMPVIFDCEIDVAAPTRLDLAGEISPRIQTCRYPLLVNGCRIVDKLDYPYDEVMWALKCAYSGSILSTALSQLRTELLSEMGIDIADIVSSCVRWLLGETTMYLIEFY